MASRDPSAIKVNAKLDSGSELKSNLKSKVVKLMSADLVGNGSKSIKMDQLSKEFSSEMTLSGTE